MLRTASGALLGLAVLALAGCQAPARLGRPVPMTPADFASWDCNRIHDELDRVQLRAAEVAYSVDQRAGKNILALGFGATVFWPALLAMRPDGLEAADLARLKERFEALNIAAGRQNCVNPAQGESATIRAGLPLPEGATLVYEVRQGTRGPSSTSVMRLATLRRSEYEFFETQAAPSASGDAVSVAPNPASLGPSRWLQDPLGNLVQGPPGALVWPKLLRPELALGHVMAGDILVMGDPVARARMRGQVVALGPQRVAGRRFEVLVVELFGDAPRGGATTRVEGSLVIDRASGILLRLDLRSANSAFQTERTLVRLEP